MTARALESPRTSKIPVFSFCIFNRKRQCVFSKVRRIFFFSKNGDMAARTLVFKKKQDWESDLKFSVKDPENAKLLWGFLFEVRRFAVRLSPETEGVKRIKSTAFTIRSGSSVWIRIRPDNGEYGHKIIRHTSQTYL